MAIFSFDRELKLTPEEAEKFFEIAMTAKPINVKPYSISEEEQKKDEELIRKWFESQRKNSRNC